MSMLWGFPSIMKMRSARVTLGCSLHFSRKAIHVPFFQPGFFFFINRQDLLNLHRPPEWTKRGENEASQYCMTDIKKRELNFSLYRYECYKYVQDEYKPKSETEEPKIGKYSMCLKYVTRIRKRNYMIPRIPKLNYCIFS